VRPWKTRVQPMVTSPTGITGRGRSLSDSVNVSPLVPLARPRKGANSRPPFLCFLQPKCKELKEISPGLSHKDAVSQASKVWNEMDEAEKAQYIVQARGLKEVLQDKFRSAELAQVAELDACDFQVSFHPVLEQSAIVKRKRGASKQEKDPNGAVGALAHLPTATRPAKF
jgi:hypothetical protein